MKTIFIIIMSISSFITYGQDTTYFDLNGKIVNSLILSHSYEIISKVDNDTNNVTVKVYYKSGQIKSEMNYNPYIDKIPNGKRKEWYENGNTHKDFNYKDGEINGLLLTYWNNSQVKRQDQYMNGKLINGKVWNSEGKIIEYYDFHILPEYPGGMNKLGRYLRKNLKYPALLKSKNIEGKVVVQFLIERDGRITNVTVAESANDLFDSEAVRVIEKMQNWKPGMEDGEPINVNYSLPIRFTIN